MRGSDDSPPRNKIDPKTPRRTFTDAEFQEILARSEERFQRKEEDPKQQDFYESRSGPGRTTFHPTDRTTAKRQPSGETQSRYSPYDGEPIIAACRAAISIHQMMYGIDPQQIRISTTMFFDLSEAKRKM